MDAMTLAQLWMGSFLILTGYSFKGRGNGWILLGLLTLTIIAGVAFVVVSGYWPLMVLPASMLVNTIITLTTAWKQAVQDAKETA